MSNGCPRRSLSVFALLQNSNRTRYQSPSTTSGVWFSLLLGWVALEIIALTNSSAVAQDKGALRCVIVELYVSDNDAKSKEAISAARNLAKSRPGIRLAIRKIDGSETVKQRLQKITKFYKVESDQTPVIYCCNQVIRTAKNEEDFQDQLAAALRMTVFKREGCPHCDAAKKYLPRLAEKFPGIEIQYRDILTEPEARTDLNRLVRKYGKAAVSTPVFHYCDSLSVGFDRDVTTGKRIEKTLTRWTIACPKKPKPDSTPDNNNKQASANTLPQSTLRHSLLPLAAHPEAALSGALEVANLFPFSLQEARKKQAF